MLPDAAMTAYAAPQFYAMLPLLYLDPLNPSTTNPL